MVVCKAATLFVKFCRGKRCPSETSCWRAKLYVCMFLIVGVQRQPPGARDPVLRSELRLSLFSSPFLRVKSHLKMLGPEALLFTTLPFPAAVFCTPGLRFFFGYTIACTHGIQHSYIVYNSTLCCCPQIPNCKMLSLFFKSQGNDTALLLGLNGYCWCDKRC